ncbi:hypothetical protein BAJUN_01610 [Bajunvirus bajun]|uniref:Uncharacterized protein n=1 Tax=Brevundimonas phage vB_BgoS-Bajun TaxID=2948594 RepID=A0A9E7N7Q2_9CAUD|nr:hypothetical protein BAJUN_01610 [Brevundimonas phage vB_BgoS-Bajun]
MSEPIRQPTPAYRAAQHVKSREAVTANAIAAWETANKRFASLCLKTVSPAIREQYRFQAVVAYEAMLDAISTERDALNALHAVANQKPPRRRGTA